MNMKKTLKRLDNIRRSIEGLRAQEKGILEDVIKNTPIQPGAVMYREKGGGPIFEVDKVEAVADHGRVLLHCSGPGLNAQGTILKTRYNRTLTPDLTD